MGFINFDFLLDLNRQMSIKSFRSLILFFLGLLLWKQRWPQSLLVCWTVLAVDLHFLDPHLLKLKVGGLLSAANIFFAVLACQNTRPRLDFGRSEIGHWRVESNDSVRDHFLFFVIARLVDCAWLYLLSLYKRVFSWHVLPQNSWRLHAVIFNLEYSIDVRWIL